MAGNRKGRKKAKTPAKRGRGRPVTTGTGTLVGVRCLDDFLSRIDAWRDKQEGEVSRPDAIRRLAELELARARPARKSGAKPGPRASEMAGQAIDKVSDESATDDERASRKRRLLKGPKEFRDMRGDLPKANS
jgi:hypothetical protein